jgi:hAT family C-terminal dimerisation region
MDIDQELELYLRTPGESADINPLYWWKTSSSNYPKLSEVAKKVLAIPATSAASENFFNSKTSYALESYSSSSRYYESNYVLTGLVKNRLG